MPICAQCGHSQVVEADKCERCGAAFSFETVPGLVPTAHVPPRPRPEGKGVNKLDEEAMVRCLQCGTPTKVGERCASCGLLARPSAE